MSDSLVIQLKGSVNDNSLLKLNEIRMGIVKLGNDVNTIQMRVKVAASDTVKLVFLDDCGTFYSDEAGTVSIGNTVSLIAGNNKVYAKANKAGVLSIENFHEVEKLGATGQWSPTATFLSNNTTAFNAEINMDNLVWNTDLQALNLKNQMLTISDLSIFSSLVNLDTFNSSRNKSEPPFGSSSAFKLSNVWNFSLNSVNADIDVNDINPKRATSNLTLEINASKTTRYTGGRALRFPGIAWLNLLGAAIPTAELDDLLISLSLSAWNGNKCVIRGTRTTASDDAVATLAGKGVTVTLI